MRRTRIRRLLGAVAAVTLSASPLAMTTPARAATVPTYATWTFTGAANAYSGTMTLGPGLPVAAFSSDSTSGSGTGVQPGSGTWLPAGSPFGAVFGSSQGASYLNLRPAANSAGSPSTTTYTFASPLAPGAWAFALGDIDADLVQVSATGPNGAVALTDLGFQGTFNYCDASPRSSTCSGLVPPYDLPAWDPGTATLTGNVTNTEGASGWFRPTVPISTLTFVFTYASGQPLYQTWFAALTRSIVGTVTTDGAGQAGVALVLTGPDGTQLATTTSGADGAYAFDGYGALAGYTVAMTTPDGLEPVGATSAGADLSATDAVVDFALTTPPPPTTAPAPTYPVTGTVTDGGGAPVSGAAVALAEPDGTPVAATTTDGGGRYTFAAVPAGTFDLTVAPTAAFQGATIQIEVPLATGEVAPIVLAALPPVPTTPAPELPATGQRGAPATSALALCFVAGGTALALGSRRKLRP